jgi:hypothetical protein
MKFYSVKLKATINRYSQSLKILLILIFINSIRKVSMGHLKKIIFIPLGFVAFAIFAIISGCGDNVEEERTLIWGDDTSHYSDRSNKTSNGYTRSGTPEHDSPFEYARRVLEETSKPKSKPKDFFGRELKTVRVRLKEPPRTYWGAVRKETGEWLEIIKDNGSIERIPISNISSISVISE